MRTGDTVRLLRLPSDLPKGDDLLPTAATFQKCVGRTFVIIGFNEIGWAEIDIESVTRSVGETIWIEPELLEVVSE